MHIGIDDSGSFVRGGGYAFMVGALVRPGRSEETRRLLRSWERGLPEGSRTAGGEVKGHLLSDEGLLSFIDDVMLASDPPIRYECNGVELGNVTFDAIEGQKTHTVEQMLEGIEMYRAKGSDFKKIANRYENMLGWWKNLTAEQILQLRMLSHLVPPLLNFAIGWSAANGFDDELGDLRFKVDEGFLSASEEKKLFWKDMLRSHIWQQTVTGNGILIIAEWPNDHPFLATFIESDLGEGKVELTHEFKNRIDFCKSHETFEIRLADIIGTLVRRMPSKLPDRFADLHIGRKGWVNLTFTGQAVDVPSPYA